MAKIKNIVDYPILIDGVINGYVIGTKSATGDTVNYALGKVYTAFKELDGGLTILHFDVDNIASIYDYHGGYLPDGISWVVIRYLKSDLTKTNAQVAANPLIVILDDAWANRETLTYNT